MLNHCIQPLDADAFATLVEGVPLDVTQILTPSSWATRPAEFVQAAARPKKTGK